MNNYLPEKGTTLPREDSPEMRQWRERLDSFSAVLREPTIQQGVDDARNGLMEARVNQNLGSGLKDKLTATSLHYSPLLKEIEEPLVNGIKDDGTFKTEVREMIKALSTPPSNTMQDHRYIQLQQMEGHPDWYGLRGRVIEGDQRLLASLRIANPQLAHEFGVLEGALADYSMQDPRMTLYWNERRNSANEVDRTIKHGLRGVAFLVAAVAAVGMGISTIINKKYDFRGPLIFAAIAGLLANPTLVKRLFSGQNANMAQDLNTALAAPDARQDVLRYGIQGRAWKNHALALMDRSAETDEFVKELDRLGPKFIGQEKIDAYVNQTMAGGGSAAREQLRQMIMDGRYGVFAGRMRSVKDENARSVVLEYISTGAGAYEDRAKNVAAEVSAE